jgi:catechol 2,3-dioxygenase-like lactoylglutathione lyase family enzyme
MRLHHLALRVRDCRAAAAFYGGVLGLREIARHGEPGAMRSIWFALGDAVLMLEHDLLGEGPTEGSGHLVALAVDDLAAAEARLAAAGVRITERTAFTLYTADPDGHRVALSTYSFA